ncbi:MAG: phosphatase [Draconibacterium sp.]|nr:MAG: phosphatase [Draconibacterium sp.]
MDIHPKAKALIFDLDGTLADTMPIHFQAYKKVLHNFGIDFKPEIFEKLAGIPAVETITRLNEMYGTNMNAQEIGHLKESVYEKMMHKIQPVEPVVALVKRYYGKIPMSVGTGGYKRLSWKSLRILKLDRYFDILVSSEDVQRPKPNPDTFLRCAELMGAKPSDCQVFEDGITGIKAAKTAGMMYTLVTDFYEVTIGKEI